MKLKDSIELITVSLKEMTSLDNQIVSDHLKYSEWFLGISTGGFLLIVSQFEHLVNNSWIENPNIETVLLIVSCSCFIFATILGAMIKNRIGRILEFSKKRLSIIVEQNLKIQFGINEYYDVEGLNKKEIITYVSSGEFLNERNKKHVQTATKYIDIYSKQYTFMLLFQQILTILAYITTFVVFVPKL